MHRAEPWRARTRRPRSAARASKPPQDWAQHLGRKVSIRFALRGDPEHPFSEAIGVVMSFEDGTLTILTKKGERVSVRSGDILAAKLFPPL